MFPSFHIAGIHVGMYSVMTFIGIVAFFTSYIFVVEKGEKLDRFSSNRVLLISLAGIAVLGVCALILNSVFHSIESKKFVFGGITWLGGVVGLFPFMIFALHKFVPKIKGNAVNFFSVMLPGLVLAHGFGRIGCFFAGCCYGKVTDSGIGVRFPEGSLAAAQYPSEDGLSQPVLPTQLIEAVFEFLLFAVMMILWKKKIKNYNVEIYLLAYGMFRFIIEFFRGDDRGSTGFFLSPSQFICIFLWIAAALLLLFRNKIIFKKYFEKCASWREEAKNLPVVQKKGEKIEAVETLKELYKMQQEGIISEEEYEKKKEEIMKRI